MDLFEDLTMNYFSLMSLPGMKRVEDGALGEYLVDEYSKLR